MQEIARLMKQLSQRDGTTKTFLPEVSIRRASRDIPRSPLLYQPGVIIVGQGSKRVYLGNTAYKYDPNHYLVLSVPIPAECEASVTEGEPFLAVFMDIDMVMLNEIIGQMEDRIDYSCIRQGCKHQGLFVAQVDDLFKDTVLRLLRCLTSPVESRVLGEGIVRELHFRIMCGENAASLHALVMKNTNLARIEKALKQIHGNFDQPFNVNRLAEVVNMSPSAFHRAFKDVTSFSPIQYLKKVRLNKAKSLLVAEGLRAKEAAQMVGYESVSQFSREFKRYFGASPTRLPEIHKT